MSLLPLLSSHGPLHIIVNFPLFSIILAFIAVIVCSLANKKAARIITISVETIVAILNFILIFYIIKLPWTEIHGSFLNMGYKYKYVLCFELSIFKDIVQITYAISNVISIIINSGLYLFKRANRILTEREERFGCGIIFLQLRIMLIIRIFFAHLSH